MKDLFNSASKTLVVVSEEDLTMFARNLILDTKHELEASIAEGKTDKLLSIKQVCEILGVNRSTLWKWSKKGYLKPIEVGGKRRYRQSDINAIIAQKGGQG